jgi:hypothetical protein
MIWLLLLPFRLLFGVVFGVLALPFVILLLPFALLLWLPFALLRLTLKVIVGLVIFPIAAVIALVALLVGGIAIAVPLIPLLVLGFCAWAVWRLVSGPAKAGHYARS